MFSKPKYLSEAKIQTVLLDENWLNERNVMKGMIIGMKLLHSSLHHGGHKFL